MCCDTLQQHSVITEGGSWISLVLFFFFTIYIHYIFFRAFFKWNSSRDKQLRKKKSHCSGLGWDLQPPLLTNTPPSPSAVFSPGGCPAPPINTDRGLQRRWEMRKELDIRSSKRPRSGFSFEAEEGRGGEGSGWGWGSTVQWLGGQTGSAKGPIIGAFGVCTGQDACLVLLGPPALQQGGQIVIGVLLVLPLPLPAEAELLSLLECPGLLLGLRGTCTWRREEGGSERNHTGEGPSCPPPTQPQPPWQRHQPVLRAEVVLLLLLAATPLALVIQWCSSAGKLSDPAGSLDAPRGSLRGGETAQHTAAGVNPAVTPSPALGCAKAAAPALLVRSSRCYWNMTCDGLLRF